MEFKEIIKNPAKFIFSLLDKKVDSPQTLNIDSGGINSLSDSQKTIKKVDWFWLLRGKTGIFLKIGVPVLIVLSLIQPFFEKNSTDSIAPPPASNTGDILQTPDFVSSEYSSASLKDSKFVLFTPKSKEIHRVGNRGTVLDKIGTEELEILLPLAINQNSYIYLKKGDLKLHLAEMVFDEEKSKLVLVENDYTLSTGINSKDEILNLHLTSDAKIAYNRNNQFFVFDLQGKKVQNLPVSEGYAYTYYEDSTYFIRPEANIYSLVRLNSTNQEVYKQDLGDLKPHAISIISKDRFLIVYESPSENSFFLVEMRDTGSRTIFKYVPKESNEKLTKISAVLFNADDNTVLLLGSKLAKLFNTSGSQLWIR